MQSLSKVFLRNFMEYVYHVLVKLAKKFLINLFLGIPMKTNTLGIVLLIIGFILGMSAWMLHGGV